MLAQAAAALALALNWATIGSAAVEPLAPPGLPPVRVIAFSSEPLDPAFLDNAKDAFGSANVLHLGLTSTFRGAASRPVYNHACQSVQPHAHLFQFDQNCLVPFNRVAQAGRRVHARTHERFRAAGAGVRVCARVCAPPCPKFMTGAATSPFVGLSSAV